MWPLRSRRRRSRRPHRRPEECPDGRRDLRDQGQDGSTAEFHLRAVGRHVPEDGTGAARKAKALKGQGQSDQTVYADYEVVNDKK